MRISDWSSDVCSSDLSIEDFCSQNSCIPNILKIDVEGAEMKVLKGASNIFSDSRFSPRMVMIELYDQNLRMFDTSIGDIVSIMSFYGYKASVIANGKKRRSEEHTSELQSLMRISY